jgi:hypothetical protein
MPLLERLVRGKHLSSQCRGTLGQMPVHQDWPPSRWFMRLFLGYLVNESARPEAGRIGFLTLRSRTMGGVIVGAILWRGFRIY